MRSVVSYSPSKPSSLTIPSPTLHSNSEKKYIPNTNNAEKRLPELMALHNETVEGLENLILDLIILDCCFEVHREASIKWKHGIELDTPLGSMQKQIASASKSAGSGQYNHIMITCPRCNTTQASHRFSSHLTKCSGGGRNSSRTARRRMMEQDQFAEVEGTHTEFDLASPPPISDQEDGDYGKRKRRTNQKKKSSSNRKKMKTSSIVF